MGLIFLSGISVTGSPGRSRQRVDYDSQLQDNDDYVPNPRPPIPRINESYNTDPSTPVPQISQNYRPNPPPSVPNVNNNYLPNPLAQSQRVTNNFGPNPLPQSPPPPPQQSPLNLTSMPQPQQLKQQLQKLKRTPLNLSQQQRKQNLMRHIQIHRQQPRLQQLNPLNIAPSHPASKNNPQRNAESIKFIGSHNLPDHFFDLRWMAKSTNKSLLDAIKATYNIRPIVRDLDLSRMDDKEIFTLVMKREIAWSYPDMNQFGLMRCEDLKFRNSPFAGYIELVPDGRRISIQKYDDSVAYQRVSQAAKDLQSRCLIKALEKTPSSATAQPGNCKTQIPFCFSDSWRQIWWKVIE